MITTINNKHNKLNFSSEREQSQACLNSAEHEKNQGRKVLNVPNLRFKEFQGEWEKCKLGDYGKVVTGNTPPTKDIENYENGTYLWASPADLGTIKSITETKTMLSAQGFSKTRTLPKGSVLVTCIGSTIGKAGMATKEMSTNQQINSIVVDDNNDNEFVYYAIQSAFPRYLSSIAVQAVPIISKSAFELLPNKRPCLQEQKKIGKFLSLLDERIATQNKIIDKLQSLINGISNQLLYANNGISVLLGEILIERSERTKENNQHEVLSSTVKGIFSQREYFSKDIASENNVGYKIIRLHDVVLSPQNLWMGNINYNGKFDVGIVSPSYKIFSIAEGFDKEYIAATLKTHRALYNYMLVSEQGASVVRRNLNMEEFEQLVFKIPSFDQQQKIGRTISVLNLRLELANKQKTLYEKEKQYLLRQIFI